MKAAKKTAPKPDLAPPPAPADLPQQPIDWVDDRDLAARTPVQRQTWQQWRIKGIGPAYYRLGKRVFYKWAEVAAWLDAQKTDPRAAS